MTTATRPSARPAETQVIVGGLVGAAVLAALVATWATLPEAVPGIPMPGPLVDYGFPTARVILDLAAMAVVGLVLLPKLVGFDADTEPVLARARRWTVPMALLWAAAALVSTFFAAAELTPGEFPDVVAYVSQIGIGQGLVVSASCALAVAGLGMAAVRYGEKVPAELRIILAMFGLLPLPVTGHASNWYWHDLSMVSMELHVMGASAWTGGLVALAVLVPRDRALLARALPRFSKLATVALLVVGCSGLFNGIVELALTPGAELPWALVTTGYGRLVVAKTVCTVLIALCGAHIRWRLLPGVARQQATAFVAWAALELTVMGLAYGVAVALTRAPVL